MHWLTSAVEEVADKVVLSQAAYKHCLLTGALDTPGQSAIVIRIPISF